MEYSLVPKSLNPSAAACAVTVYCKQPLEAIFWCAQEAFPDGLVQSESKQIRFTQNGTYFIQMVTQSQIYHAKIKISTIKAFRGFDGGDGSAQHPYILSNFVQFCAIVKDVRAHYRLVADLDFAEMLGDLSWLPIGKYSCKEPKIDPEKPLEDQLGYVCNHGFCGELDGNGHCISRIKCHIPKLHELGLFGSCGEGACIHDLSIQGGDFYSKDCYSVGAIVGRAQQATIERCRVEAVIRSALDGGGIVGSARDRAVIRACRFSGTLLPAEERGCNSGGIVGESEMTVAPDFVRIEDCYADVRAIGARNVGGITTGGALIHRCFAKGELLGLGCAAGILVGGTISLVKNCVCAVASIACTEQAHIAEQCDFWVTFSNDQLEETGFTFAQGAWRNYAGRILTDDHTLSVDNPTNSNYGADTCALMAQGVAASPIDASLRDGKTATAQKLLDPEFYRGLGWDAQTIWDIQEGAYPCLRGKA